MGINQPSKPNTSRMQSITNPQAGTAAPDFTTQNTTGKTVHLKDFRGKKLVLGTREVREVRHMIDYGSETALFEFLSEALRFFGV